MFGGHSRIQRSEKQGIKRAEYLVDEQDMRCDLENQTVFGFYELLVFNTTMGRIICVLCYTSAAKPSFGPAVLQGKIRIVGDTLQIIQAIRQVSVWTIQYRYETCKRNTGCTIGMDADCIRVNKHRLCTLCPSSHQHWTTIILNYRVSCKRFDQV